MLARPAALIALALLTTISCGGGGAGTCGGSPCGGDISPGRYKISSFCSSVVTIKSDTCSAGVTVDPSGASLTGTLTFNADKTYVQELTESGHFVESIPASCLTQQGVTITCAQLQQFLTSDPGSMDGVESISCAGSSGCNCTITVKAQTNSESGTYATSGTNLTLTPTGGAPESGPYCATPTQITLIDTAMASMAMPGMPAIEGTKTIVLTKE